MLSHWNLNPACLPIPPQAHIVCIIAHEFLRGKTYHHLAIISANRDDFSRKRALQKNEYHDSASLRMNRDSFLMRDASEEAF